ncbi:glutamate--cysteine ligase catalytic subunit-like isoform X2 [Stegodyphus dumicola]|uniref:glutamate--cysteine ligase catalytic subunit-like isoform X2 n=1 Tax=Stegodyphus dumicola TaxID=202533 RepID=UPI0015AC89B6|nr:glutamate--cysteine ligase catalytic subunit-like isoform X2 [Stegodyphus dumicola]
MGRNKKVEYMVIKFDHSKKTAKVCLKAERLLAVLLEKEKENHGDVKALWRPEFGAYMIEGTPGKPYGALSSCFNVVEANMRARRLEVTDLLESDESLLCLTSFPRLGCAEFTFPPATTDPKGSALCSLFFPDAAVYGGHPRFKTLARNIRQRRGRKVVINVPIYRDRNTPDPFVEDFTNLGDDGEAAAAALPNHVYMDAMGFGMGCSCLQVTFQACNINEARTLYDQLAPVCPIALALSAASPVHRGYLTDRDCRWDIIAASVDDRTYEELGVKPLQNNKFRINKSRYDSIDSYLSPAGEKFNDIDLIYDEDIYKLLRESGIDHLLAQHVAHLFIRDPISLFSEKIHQNDDEDTDHFENIQSTNWQTMRFKPPPPNSSIGWRVEFRSMEVQMTEFENAAYVVFIVLLTRVILTFQLNFLIPVSKVDDNLSKAQKRDAVLHEKFWFRKDLTTCESPPEAAAYMAECCSSDECQYTLMTINEIINGKENEFPGLVPLIQKFLTSMDIDVDTQCSIQQYLKLIQLRAKGELMTTARWIRNFVAKHPSYKFDSVVNERINYDLLTTVDRITQGKEECPEILGHPTSRTREHIPNAVRKAENSYSNLITEKVT